MIIDKPTSKEIPALRQLWKQAFGDTDAFLDSFFAHGFAFDRCRCVRIDGVLVAALYWFDCRWQGKKVAYLYAVATDMAFRGKRLCRMLMEDTHSHLQEAGYAGAALVPGSRELLWGNCSHEERRIFKKRMPEGIRFLQHGLGGIPAGMPPFSYVSLLSDG